MLHEPGFLLAEQPFEAAVFFKLDDVACIDAVQQVVVEVSCAGLFELFGEDAVAIGGGVEEREMQLGGQREALARMALDQDYLHRALAGEPVVHPCGVEVGEAPLQEQVDHLLELLDVYRRLIGWIDDRQTHETKPEFLHNALPRLPKNSPKGALLFGQLRLKHGDQACL